MSRVTTPLIALLLLTSCGVPHLVEEVLAPPAEAQTYVRPSKGRAITLATSITQADGTLVSSVYDMSSFAAVQVITSLPGNPASCTYTPRFYTRVSGTATGAFEANFAYDYNAFVDFAAVGSSGGGAANTMYYVNNLPPYVQFVVDWIAGAGGGTCAFSVSIVPLPYNVLSGPHMNSAVGCTSVSTTAVAFGSVGTGPYFFTMSDLTLQNAGTVAVTCGNLDVTATTGITLAAGTSANDGTGGSLTFAPNVLPVGCRTAAGTTSVCYWRR